MDRDALSRQLSHASLDLTACKEQLEGATAGKAAAESKLAALDSKLAESAIELTALRQLRGALEDTEARLAAVTAREEVAEREEEKTMRQKRVYKTGKGHGADSGSAAPFDYDVSFEVEPSAGSSPRPR